MARDELIIDWRSTGRRKGRRELFKARVDFCCVDCGKTTKTPPKDAPIYFDEIWPYENRSLNPQSLQCDHEDKDYTNNNIENINWRCSSCHKKRDQQTKKGESTIINDIASYL